MSKFKTKNWNKLSIDKQDEIADHYFKERDSFAFNDDGTEEKELMKQSVEENE